MKKAEMKKKIIKFVLNIAEGKYTLRSIAPFEIDKCIADLDQLIKSTVEECAKSE